MRAVKGKRRRRGRKLILTERKIPRRRWKDKRLGAAVAAVAAVAATVVTRRERERKGKRGGPRWLWSLRTGRRRTKG